jgi:hypothetical protein
MREEERKERAGSVEEEREEENFRSNKEMEITKKKNPKARLQIFYRFLKPYQILY